MGRHRTRQVVARCAPPTAHGRVAVRTTTGVRPPARPTIGGRNPLRAVRSGLIVMAALTLAAACTDGSSSTSGDTGPATSGATAVPSQGVTDTEVAIGVAWIDAQEILDQFGVDIGVYPVEIGQIQVIPDGKPHEAISREILEKKDELFRIATSMARSSKVVEIELRTVQDESQLGMGTMIIVDRKSVV